MSNPEIPPLSFEEMLAQAEPQAAGPIDSDPADLAVVQFRVVELMTATAVESAAVMRGRDVAPDLDLNGVAGWSVAADGRVVVKSAGHFKEIGYFDRTNHYRGYGVTADDQLLHFRSRAETVQGTNRLARDPVLSTTWETASAVGGIVHTVEPARADMLAPLERLATGQPEASQQPLYLDWRQLLFSYLQHRVLSQ